MARGTEDSHDRIGDEFQGGGFQVHVDVLCAGRCPGVLAYAIACVDRDLSVLLVDAPPLADLTDPGTVGYLRAMTDDLGSLPADLALAVTRAQALPPPAGGRTRIEPFHGGRLRDWSARCSASAFGVLWSDVPDVEMTPLRSESGEIIRAVLLGDYQPAGDRPGLGLADWLTDQAGQRDLEPDTESTLQRLIFEGQCVVGAALDTGSGTLLVRAGECVALCPGPIVAGDEWPIQSDLGDGLDVALVWRTAARFGRVELIDRSTISPPA